MRDTDLPRLYCILAQFNTNTIKDMGNFEIGLINVLTFLDLLILGSVELSQDELKSFNFWDSFGSFWPFEKEFWMTLSGFDFYLLLLFLLIRLNYLVWLVWPAWINYVAHRKIYCI